MTVLSACPVLEKSVTIRSVLTLVSETFHPSGIPVQVTLFVPVGILLDEPFGLNPVTGLPSGSHAMSLLQSAGASPLSYMKSWVMVRLGSSSAVHW